MSVYNSVTKSNGCPYTYGRIGVGVQVLILRSIANDNYYITVGNIPP